MFDDNLLLRVTRRENERKEPVDHPVSLSLSLSRRCLKARDCRHRYEFASCFQNVNAIERQRHSTTRQAKPFFGHLPRNAVDMTSLLTFLSLSLARVRVDSTRKSNVANEKKSISNPNSLSKRERREEKKQQKIPIQMHRWKKKEEREERTLGFCVYLFPFDCMHMICIVRCCFSMTNLTQERERQKSL